MGYKQRYALIGDSVLRTALTDLLDNPSRGQAQYNEMLIKGVMNSTIVSYMKTDPMFSHMTRLRRSDRWLGNRFEAHLGVMFRQTDYLTVRNYVSKTILPLILSK